MRPDGKETDKEYICYPCWSTKLLDWTSSLTTERDSLAETHINDEKRIDDLERMYELLLSANELNRISAGKLWKEKDSLAAALAEAKENFNLCMEQYDIQQERACNAEARLAEAEADADRLAKELQDWLVFAEANDQIYAARSGMNAMLHHQKRKEGK